MKTAHVSTSKRQANNNVLATLKKVSVNPAMSPFKGFTKKPENRLSIRGYELKEWLQHLTGSTGVYFLDMGTDQGNYSMHFRHHASGKVMELDCQEELKESEDRSKEFLEAMLFDLSLFPEEPILVLNSDAVETTLRNLAATYYERAKEIDCIIGRLVNVDMKKLFESGIYSDSRVKEFSIDSIYQALYPGTSRLLKKSKARTASI